MPCLSIGECILSWRSGDGGQQPSASPPHIPPDSTFFPPPPFFPPLFFFLKEEKIQSLKGGGEKSKIAVLAVKYESAGRGMWVVKSAEGEP